MTKVQSRKKVSLSKRICLTAVFASLICVCTFIAVPLPFGYFNLGDIFVLLAAWLLPAFLGGLAAGLGAGIADLLMGYALYSPATLVIKFLVGVCAFYLYRVFKKLIAKSSLDFLPRAISAIFAECIMILGYFFFESVCLGYGLGATASLVGNGLQALCGVLGSVAIISALSPIPSVKNWFKF